MKKYQISLGEKKIIKDQGLLQFEEIKKQIQILPELEQLIPPLLPDELHQLEQNILREGCREALLIWQTTEEIIAPESKGIAAIYVLIDGHNRYSICSKHGIDFKIHLVDFKSLYDVRQYMIDNQLGRRNLTPEQISYLRGMKYLTEKKEKGKYERIEHKGHFVPYGNESVESVQVLGGEEHKGHFVPYGNEVVESTSILGSEEHKGHFVPYAQETLSTSEKLGKRYNVSGKTIKRDAEFASGLEKLEPALKSEILAGKTKVNKTLIQQIGKSEVQTLPIATIEEIEDMAKLPSIVKKVVVKSVEETPREALIRRLTELTKQLQQTGDAAICDEIIRCASKIKKIIP
ncbi:hypothetical protein [Runella salmonicolor]|uniref:ParB/Sulfiredoxin domain-containing protein n=1 Tax=Runella salmonicolor TaxID=2950278 RepID=A0ABT1G0J6_9BACT|nr:hypothetical protein [Runella salmonicolor]MCP1386563.1 hypothetical protein [Runella salmonicolor]